MSQVVLVVEDDRELARSLARTLDSAGYSVQQAHDGEQAMREVEKARPDLVLLDLLLPKMDGQEVLARLKKDESTRGIPVLAMSGVFRGKGHARSLLEAGAVGLLEKPFPAEVLLGELKAVLGEPEPPEPPAAPESRLASTEHVSLLKRPVAELLWELTQTGFSGLVHFQWEKRQKAILLEEGQPRRIRSNLARECLARRLKDAGHVGESILEQTFKLSRRSGRLHGELLVEQGALTAKELAAALASQSEEKLMELFAWRSGEAWTESGVRELTLASSLEGWSPRRVILQGAERMRPELVQRRLLLDADRVVVRATLEVDSGEQPVPVARLLARLDSGGTVSELAEQHGAVLYGLWVIGGVRFESAPGADEQGAPGALRQLREHRDAQSDQSHFEILGVSDDASSAEIRSAFVKLAREFHPDRYRGVSPEATRLAAEIFAGVSAAHDVLSDPKSRQTYASQRRRGSSVEAEREEVMRVLGAEAEFSKGEECLKRRNHQAALEHFSKAVEMNPEEGEFHGFYGWSLFLSQQQDPSVQAQAVEHLERAIGLAPRSVTGYYYLGRLRRTCGDEAEAGKMFRKVIEISPEHVEAAQELRLLGRRQTQHHDAGSGGLFGFGQKRR